MVHIHIFEIVCIVAKKIYDKANFLSIHIIVVNVQIIRYNLRTQRTKKEGMQLMLDLNKIESFISKQKICFICSIDENGFPNMKAMMKPRKRNGIVDFYFITSTKSLRVKQYEDNPNASIYFYHKGLFQYEAVMLVGTMKILKDQEIKDMIWQKEDLKTYSKGVTDPNYCVLKFTANGGRYYNGKNAIGFSNV